MGWEAARPCVSKKAKPAKIVSLIEKDFCARQTKRKRNFCWLCRPPSGGEPLGGTPRAKRAAIFHFSEIFDKVGSSAVVNILYARFLKRAKRAETPHIYVAGPLPAHHILILTPFIFEKKVI